MSSNYPGFCKLHFATKGFFNKSIKSVNMELPSYSVKPGKEFYLNSQGLKNSVYLYPFLNYGVVPNPNLQPVVYQTGDYEVTTLPFLYCSEQGAVPFYISPLSHHFYGDFIYNEEVQFNRLYEYLQELPIPTPMNYFVEDISN